MGDTSEALIRVGVCRCTSVLIHRRQGACSRTSGEVMKKAADSIALMHGFIIVSHFAGVIFISAYPAYAGYQLVYSGIMLATWIMFGSCPCTVWERKLRKRYDPAGAYEGQCITHYAQKHLGITISEWAIRVIMYYSVLASGIMFFFRGS